MDRGCSKRGRVAVGVAAVRSRDGTTQVGLAVSTPSARCDLHQLPALIATLGDATRRVMADLLAAR
jgi:hypothetical protein